ncbi:spermatogenic leucine zipper protein 1 [Sorex fumeus]|uniref:spermatogenic leucine zipper protein 1 n=1 Tax=Sorex fumeus TaxID=62283 RepID=UPI0024ADB872|nr:spermatogenic leucine zipper protein 1 [Sorex fumeus]
MEVPTFSITLNPPTDVMEECMEPGLIVAIIELEPKIAGMCHHHNPVFASKKNGCPATENQVHLKLEILLKELSHILQAVTSYPDVGDNEVKAKVWENVCCCSSRSVTEGDSSLEEKVKGCDKLNKVFVNNLTSVEKEKNQKKQERIWKNRNTKDAKHGHAKHSESDSEPTKAYSEAQVNKIKTKHRPPSDLESKNCITHNTEQLLQEVEEWCVQHTELNELIKSCQKAQEDIETSASNQDTLNPTQESAQLEEEVKKLKQETYSLNLFATLLDNECRILKQRIELFKELKHHHHPHHHSHHHSHHHRQNQEEKLLQKSPELNKKEQVPLETEKRENIHHKLHDTKGPYQKKEKVCTSLDFCCNKKACNNRLNLRIARKVLWGRKKQHSNPK